MAGAQSESDDLVSSGGGGGGGGGGPAGCFFLPPNFTFNMSSILNPTFCLGGSFLGADLGVVGVALGVVFLTVYNDVILGEEQILD